MDPLSFLDFGFGCGLGPLDPDFTDFDIPHESQALSPGERSRSPLGFPHNLDDSGEQESSWTRRPERRVELQRTEIHYEEGPFLDTSFLDQLIQELPEVEFPGVEPMDEPTDEALLSFLRDFELSDSAIGLISSSLNDSSSSQDEPDSSRTTNTSASRSTSFSASSFSTPDSSFSAASTSTPASTSNSSSSGTSSSGPSVSEDEAWVRVGEEAGLPGVVIVSPLDLEVNVQQLEGVVRRGVPMVRFFVNIEEVKPDALPREE